MRYYPRNWTKISSTMRRRFPCCQLCQSRDRLSVHHKGIPYANGKQGNFQDKFDCRLENLQVLCLSCHRKENDRQHQALQFMRQLHRSSVEKGGIVPSGYFKTKRIEGNGFTVEIDETPPLFFPFVQHVNRPEYPSNWSKVSWLVRRSYGFRCEWCKSSRRVRCYHMGVPYPDGTPGTRRDKHDLRIENLYPLCETCERIAKTLF